MIAKTAKVSTRRNSYGEWTVTYYDANDKLIKNATYHTKDKDDALGTAALTNNATARFETELAAEKAGLLPPFVAM